MDSDSLPVPQLLADPGYPILRPTGGLLTPDLFWNVTGETTLEFGREKGVRQNGYEGDSTKVANAVLAFAFLPGITLVARIDDPLHYGGILDDHPAIFRLVSCFSCTT